MDINELINALLELKRKLPEYGINDPYFPVYMYVNNRLCCINYINLVGNDINGPTHIVLDETEDKAINTDTIQINKVRYSGNKIN